MNQNELNYYDKYIFDQYMILLDLRDVIENCEEYVEYHPSLKLQLELKEIWAKLFSDDIDRIFSNRWFNLRIIPIILLRSGNDTKKVIWSVVSSRVEIRIWQKRAGILPIPAIIMLISHSLDIVDKVELSKLLWY